MKLRIKGNSLRLRVLRSELDHLAKGHCIEEAIHFGPSPDARLVYALCVRAHQQQPIEVEFEHPRLAVCISPLAAELWFRDSEVSMGETIEISDTASLTILIEKDFACLDASDEENEDTFVNPLATQC